MELPILSSRGDSRGRLRRRRGTISSSAGTSRRCCCCFWLVVLVARRRNAATASAFFAPAPMSPPYYAINSVRTSAKILVPAATNGGRKTACCRPSLPSPSPGGMALMSASSEIVTAEERDDVGRHKVLRPWERLRAWFRAPPGRGRRRQSRNAQKLASRVAKVAISLLALFCVQPLRAFASGGGFGGGSKTPMVPLER